MAIEHNTITDNEIHEPKGVSSATSGEVYVANGAGSGAWQDIYLQGFEDFNDTGGSQALTSGVWVDLTNDGAGPFSVSNYRLPGYGPIWDTVNNQFDWSGAGNVLGNTVDIRFDFSVTTTGVNHEIAFRLDMAHGDPGEYPLEFDRRIFKSAGTYGIIRWVSVYFGDTTTLNNPAKLAMISDAAGDSVVVNGWYCRTQPRNPVFL